MAKVRNWGKWGVLVVGGVTGGFLLMGWALMLTVGAVFHEFGILRPIGFWPALGIAAGTFVVVSMLRSGSRPAS